ncbi:MAG: 50S ribosomal protein L19 [Deferribacterota bacterium]|nr:50S ribosomal protein L19 [Deferribacterota bacterium]
MRDKIIDAIEEEFKNKNIPSFRSGDTIVVNFRITEGGKERIQPFQGIVIRKHNNGLSSTFTVRKMSGKIGVERIFPLYSPLIESIKVVRAGKVRQSRIYYIRNLKGRALKIKERRKGF